MLKILLVLTFLSSPMNSFAQGNKKQEGKAVRIAKNVNIHRYLGRWYAITSLPQAFTRDCTAQTADYSLTQNNDVFLKNTCIKSDGSTSGIEGVARVKDAPNNAILEIEFDEFFNRLFGLKGDYIIFKLDSKYRYALIGSRNLKSMWLLSRTKTVSDKVYDEYISRAKEIGFDINKLQDSNF